MTKEKLLQLNTRYSFEVSELFQSISEYDEATLNGPSATGGWNVLQTMHHLILSEEKSLEYVRKKLSFDGAYQKTGFRESWRYFLLATVFMTPIKFKAPPLVGGNPEVLPSHSTLKETEARWMEIRQQWTVFFEEIAPDLAIQTVYKHPRAGKIGWSHLLRFFIVHLKRHKKQIKNTLKNQKLSLVGSRIP